MLQNTVIQPYIVSLVPVQPISNLANVVLLQSNDSNSVSTDVASTRTEENFASNVQHTVKRDIYVCTFCPVYSSQISTVSSHVSRVHSESLPAGTNPEDFVAKLKNLIAQHAVKKDIYVCTFCQDFSPQITTVSNHISLVHSGSLPAGAKPEDFISKLDNLIENCLKKSGKRGRPKKIHIESIVPENSKQKKDNPIPDSEGLFWCKSCVKSFRKSRQLMQHICIDPEEELSSEESLLELDEDVEFKTHMNVNPSPWSRMRKNGKLKDNSEIGLTEGDGTVENKVLPNWRKDPAYIPLFDDEKEKAAFEEHLKSIDYSFVDNMYQVKNKNKKNFTSNGNVAFSCDFCRKEFKSLSHIRAHCLIHTDVKPFTCLKCSYRTNSCGSLYLHMRKHTGNVFCCSSCDFKCVKRSHLLDHEATHSTEHKICKLCKNSYKTLKSLINHVRKYHDYPNGKKYMKLLTSKQSKFLCNICNKKFKTLDILTNHNHACHENTLPSVTAPTEENACEQSSENVNHEATDVQMQISHVNNVESPIAVVNHEITDMQIPISHVNNVESPMADLQCDSLQSKDYLAEMVLNDLLQQQQQSQNIMYPNVFNQANENIISSSNNNLLCNLQEAKVMVERLETSIIEEYQRTLDLDIFEKCLQNTGFSNQCEEFNLIPNISGKHSLQTNSESNSNVASNLNEIPDVKLDEPKSVEIKLFEKCQQTPAYVCCVCSSIYICPATLKAHLKEHVNSTINSLMDQAEEQQFENASTKVAETSNELDVCKILQDSSESFSFDKEVEKLYTSSLDMMYYLPEVSVVLENDAALFDSVLDDISSFPINDNSSQDLESKLIKVDEADVLKIFP